MPREFGDEGRGEGIRGDQEIMLGIREDGDGGRRGEGTGGWG